MTRIFFIIPTLKQGGAERVMAELANHFIHYHDVEIHLVLLAKAEIFYQIDSRIIIHELGFENNGFFQKKMSELRTFIKLRTLLREHRPDSVLSFMDKYNVFTLLASAFTGTKVFVSERSNPHKKRTWKMQLLRRFIYPSAKGIIAQTELAKMTLVQLTKHKNIKVISNPVKEIKSFPEIERENIIINVGRLVPEKGQKYLIDAFGRIDPKEWKLVILGEGPLKGDLKNQAEALNITDKIELPGAVKEVDWWLAKSSIFVFPSVSEGFPNALVEAMAAGLPCISFDCDSGPRDIIENGVNGILVEEKDVDTLADFLSHLMKNEELRRELSIKAMRIKEILAVDKVAEEYFKFITTSSTK